MGGGYSSPGGGYRPVRSESRDAVEWRRVLDNRVSVPFGKSSLVLNQWLWSDEAMSTQFLEEEHDYVQWLLPSDEPSAHNPHAPVLTARDCEFARLWARHRLDNVIMGAVLMLSFFGKLVVFHGDHDRPVIVPGPGAEDAAQNIAKNRHNVLRVTRLVRCVRIHGFCALAMQAAISLNHTLNDLGLGGESTYIWDKEPNVVFANRFMADEYRAAYLAHEQFRSFESAYFDEVSADGFPLHEYARLASTIWCPQQQ